MTSNAMSALRVKELLEAGRRREASDIHVLPDSSPVLRIDGTLIRFGGIVKATESAEMLNFFSADDPSQFYASGDLTIAWRDPQLGSFRIHAYRSRLGVALAIRLLALKIPTLEGLNLPIAARGFAEKSAGLVLFTGPTGSGKTTALAALTDEINRACQKHVLTIEDPVEYEFISRMSIITQREIGRDVRTFAKALRGALRSDPDVIIVGEMRDPETIAAALTAAETGHLVFATLHTADSAQTIDRILDAFSGDRQTQVRMQLAQTLMGVVCLRLVPRANTRGRCAAAEVLVVNDAVRNLIRERKTHQVRNVIETGKQAGMQTLEDHLSELVMRREITIKSARAVTDRPSEVRHAELTAS